MFVWRLPPTLCISTMVIWGMSFTLQVHATDNFQLVPKDNSLMGGRSGLPVNKMISPQRYPSRANRNVIFYLHDCLHSLAVPIFLHDNIHIHLILITALAENLLLENRMQHQISNIPIVFLSMLPCRISRSMCANNCVTQILHESKTY